MRKFGIDVSRHQGEIDWKEVKSSGVEFAIIRSGYGRLASQRDENFEYNYKKCVENKIPCGTYWYSYAKTKAEAIQEANACYEVIKDKAFEYPIYFDIEDSSQISLGSELISEIIKAFCSELERKNYWVGVYSYKSFLEDNLIEDIKDKYAVWVAHTGVEKTNYSGQYGIWQYSHTGRINGINSDVDLNYCYIDYPKLMKETGKNLIFEAKPEYQEYTIYTVKKNDTLWDISEKFYGDGSKYEKIKQFNNLKSDTIFPNQELKIPK